jgi:protease-4
MAQSKALRDELLSFKKIREICNGLCQFLYTKNTTSTSPIYINPVGDMDFKGLSAELMFFKDLQENRSKSNTPWKIQSAVEPFLENEMSDANREQVTVLNSL